MNIAHPESLLFWICITFAILFLILRKFAWNPILSALKEREDGINNALLAADEAKKEVANLKADNEKLLNEARAERDIILKEAREIKEKIISEAKNQAEQEGLKIINQAKQVIENEKKVAINEIKTQIATLSLDIARKAVKTELSEKNNQEKLIESLLSGVSLK